MALSVSKVEVSCPPSPTTSVTSSESSASCARPFAVRKFAAAFQSPSASTADSEISDTCSDDDTGSASPGHSGESTFKQSCKAIIRQDSHSDGSSTIGRRSTSASASSSSPSWSVVGVSSDSEISDSESTSVASETFLVYPVVVLLRLRAAALLQQRRCGSPGPHPGQGQNFLGYSARPSSELPVAIPAPDPIPEASKIAPPSTSSWSAARKSRADESSDDKIIRTARSILNKLTVEKFDSLYEQLLQSGLRTLSHMRHLMQEVFEKATVQHHFIPMYADLCLRLESDTRVILASEEASASIVDSFRRLLLDRCQVSFEELLSAEGAEGPSDADDDEAKALRKHRVVGNVKFVGHLLTRGMLSSRLMTQCCEDLLEARAQCPEALECLAAFLTTAAPHFDGLGTAWPLRAQLDGIFKEIAGLSRAKDVASRERFLLRDVLDAREGGWPNRPCAAKPSAPMRLEEVRKAADADSQQVVAVKRPPTQPRRTSGASKVETPVRAAARPPPQQLAQQPKRAAQPPSKPASPDLKPAAAAAEDARATQPPPPPQPAPRRPVARAPVAAPATAHAVHFDAVAFRRELTATMKELSQGCGVPTAVQRIREQHVPTCRQAAEFSDILTRAAEESRGPSRRSAFAFAAGLAAAGEAVSAFDRQACLEGIAVFFREVFDDLAEEVPRLSAIVKAELLPTLKSVLPESSLRAATPIGLWVH